MNFAFEALGVDLQNVYPTLISVVSKNVGVLQAAEIAREGSESLCT